MKKIIFFCGAIISLFFIESCKHLQTDEVNTLSNSTNSLNDYISQTTNLGNEPLYILSSATKHQTKSLEQENSCALSNYLNLDNISETTEGIYTILQIPFKDNYNLQEVSLYSGECDSLKINWTYSKKYFILISQHDSQITTGQVVTMIPFSDSIPPANPTSFSFFDRHSFNGIIIYADIFGNPLAATYNNNGPIYGGQLIDRNFCESDIRIIVPSQITTKSISSDNYLDDGSILLDGSICTAFRKNSNKLGSSFFEYIDYLNNGAHFDSGDINLIGGGNTGGGHGSFDPFLYQIKLDVIGQGEIDGDGMYHKNASVRIKASSTDKWKFLRWNGDFSEKDSLFVYTVTRDVSSTALFQQSKGCYDKEKGINSVINNQKLAPTTNNNEIIGNYLGADYGWTRSGGTRFHKGIDIAASIGTPIYAPADGIIKRVVSSIEPGEYNRDDNPNLTRSNWAAGNRIWLECTINNTKVLFKFFHLRSNSDGGGVADGVFKDAKILRGQILGYTGDTGNAYSVYKKHLHLEAWVDGNPVDPWLFINGEKDIETGQIINVRCNNEFIDNPHDDILDDFISDNNFYFWDN